MNTTIDALVEALRPIAEHGEISAKIIADARAALAQARAEQAEPLYTEPQPAQPVAVLEPLTEAEVLALYQKYGTSRHDGFEAAVRAVKAAHAAKLAKLNGITPPAEGGV